LGKLYGGGNMIDTEIKFFAESLEDEIVEYDIIPYVVVSDATY